DRSRRHDAGLRPAAARRADLAGRRRGDRPVRGRGEPRRGLAGLLRVTRDVYGAIERNACDGKDAPCTHAMSPVLSPPALAPFHDGYALVWGEGHDALFDGADVRVQLL